MSSVCSRRVVVTGLGLVCPLGVGVPYVWQRLLRGETGITAVRGDGFNDIPCKVAGYVPVGNQPGQLDLDKTFTKSHLKEFSRATAFAQVAADEALKCSRWEPKTLDEQERTGVAVGMGMIDLEDVVSTGTTLRERGYGRVGPYFIPKVLPNMAAGQISIHYGLKGPNHTVSTACATGTHAIGDAFNFIRWGAASVMVCGGSDAVIGPLSIAAFARMKALSTSFNSEPRRASRPFDKRREGFVMAEGAGILVLETLEHAQERGAKIYAEILGYGLTGDAHHITAPSPDGRGAYRSMTSALRDGQLRPEDVSYVNAHATSTPVGDIVEAKAIGQVFETCANRVLVSSTKGAVGHLLGAAGCVETVFTVMACHTGHIPPTVNLEEPDDEINLHLVSNNSQLWPAVANNLRRVALTNSFGFGGTNATLVISSVD